MIVSQFLETFKEYPPSQASGGLTVTQFLEAVSKGASGAGKQLTVDRIPNARATRSDVACAKPNESKSKFND